MRELGASPREFCALSKDKAGKIYLSAGFRISQSEANQGMERRTPEQAGVESAISNVVEWIRLGVETIGAIIVVVGVAMALWLLITRRDKMRFNLVRLTLARFLALALEFQLAADILSTTIAPSWDKIGKLAVIAIIRTALNFFLMREMKEAAEVRDHEAALHPTSGEAK